MKRITGQATAPLLFGGLFLLMLPVFALQGAASPDRPRTVVEVVKSLQEDMRKLQAGALNDRRDIEEDIKRLESTLNSLLDSYAEMQGDLQRMQQLVETQDRNISDLKQSLTSEITRASSQFVTQEQFEKLGEQLKQLNDRREADNRKVLEENRKMQAQLDNMLTMIEKMGEGISRGPRTRPSPAPTTPSPAPPSTPPPPAKQYRIYEYPVGEGQFLGQILSAWNEELKKQGYDKGVTMSMVKEVNPGLNPDRISVGQKIKLPYPD